MASLGSFTRSAARATFSAYRTVPIRWRLAGGSAFLTFVILAGFAAIADVVTVREVRGEFVNEMRYASGVLKLRTKPTVLADGDVDCGGLGLANFGVADNAQIRVFDSAGTIVCSQAGPGR